MTVGTYTQATNSGGSLRAARREAGLSRQRLAELAGCSIGYLTLLERGYAPITSDVLPRVIAALNDVSPAANRAHEKVRDDGAPLSG